MSRSFALICCLVAALAAVAAGQVEPEQTSPPLVKVDDFTAGTGATPIKFGCMLPFSGDNAVKGAAARNGIMMAITDAAKKYTMYTFTLTCKDTQCSSTNSATAASDLKKAKVVAAIGDVCSGASLPAKDNLAPILLISPSATSDTLTNSTDNFLRTVAPDKFQSRVLSTLVRGNTTTIPKAIPVVVVFDSGTYGLGLATGFSAAYKKAGGRIRFNTTVTATNAKDAATDLATQKVTRIVIATNNNTWVGEFLAAGAAISGFSPSVFAGDAQLNPQLPDLVANFSGAGPAGKALLNKLSVTAYNQGTAAFRSKYAAFTSKAPYTGHAAHAYDAFNVLMKGYVEDAKKGPVVAIGIATPLNTTFVGVGGNIKFDASGDLIPDNKAYQSIKYNPTTGAVVYGSFLAIPPAK